METQTPFENKNNLVLIAEDSPTQAAKLRFMLENYGYEVIVGQDGKKALELALEHNPSLIISDIIMPEMNGYELCKALKHDKRTKEIPVILLTSLSNSEDVLESLVYSADSFISKPYNEDFLISQIGKTLDGKAINKEHPSDIDLEISVGGKVRSIKSNPAKMLTLLISTYEAAMNKNNELVHSQEQLRMLNERLEDLVEERTAELSAEIAKHVKTQEELKNSFSLLEATLESTIDGILVVDLEGRIIKFNRKFVELLKMPEALLQTQKDSDALNHILGQLKYPDQFISKVQELYRDNFIESFDLIEFKDGRIFERYSRPQLIEGKVVGRVWSFWDITERKLLEDAQNFLLHCGYPGSDEDFFESLAQYLSQSLNMGYVCIDRLDGDGLTAHTVAIYNSGRFDTNVSYALKETPCGAVVEKAVCCFPENVCQLFPNDAALQELKAESYIGTTLRSFDGKPIGLIAVIDQKPIKNITAAEALLKLVAVRAAGELERQQAENLLRKSEEKYRKDLILLNSILESPVDIIVFSLDKNYCYTAFTNFHKETIKKIWGVDIKLGMCVLDVILIPEDWKKAKINFDRALHGEHFALTEDYGDDRLLRPFFDNYYSPIKDSNGEIIGISVFVIDVTTRKVAEDALKQSESLLRELNTHKDKFFSIIAHDLKSPFNSILGFSEILVEQIRKKDYDGIEKYAEIINQSSNKAVGLLMNLMEWARSQTGRMEFNPEYLEISDLISEVSLIFDDVAGQKSISIFKDLPRAATVYADKAMISTVLRNLISNAIKFTFPGGKITIRTTEKPDGLTVCVQDYGVGMSKSVVEKLFRLDENYTSTGTNNEKGTGLGLVLCKEFIEKHGGKIWVDSELGGGSTFYFTIPVNIGQSPNIGFSKTARVADEKTWIDQARLKTIIAEDDVASAMFLSTISKPFSNQIILAETGIQAVEACRKNPGIDLILMDIKMPGMDGIEATKQIREFNKDVIIIAQTAFAYLADKEKVLKAGCNDYLTKPVKNMELKSLINKYFQINLLPGQQGVA